MIGPTPPSPALAAVALRDVKKRFGAFEAVRGVSVTVAPGEFVVIVGPSGCGKSTLLRMVAGLEEITEGEIVIGERVVNALEPKDRDIAMVFQNYALYPHMDVFGNMAYGLRNRHLAAAEIEQRVQEAARILELGPLLRRKPRQLSGGQRQRVAMGRAIVRHPKVYLFDEPLSNLDAKLRVQMRLEIQKLHRRLAVTSLYVTHDQIEAMTLGSRIIVMNAGRAEQIGTPDDVYHRPATIFVAAFLGAPPMNLIRGRLSADGRTLATDDGVINLPVSERAMNMAPVGRDAVLGVRPEELLPGGTQMNVAVEMVESLGADRLLHTSIGAQSVVVRSAAQERPAPGTTLSLGFRADAMHWFDAVSGARCSP